MLVVEEKNLCIDFNTPIVMDTVKENFEFNISSKGFKTDKNTSGDYISELTQSAWMGYALCYIALTNEEIIPSVNTDESVPVKIDKPEVSVKRQNKNKEQIYFLPDKDNDSDLNVLPDAEPIKRGFNKRLYESKSLAVKQAQSVNKEHGIPMWVHPANGEHGWHISSHGFSVTRRPDIPVPISAIDDKQIFYGFPPSGIAEKIQPSVISRIAYSGSVFTQNGEYFNENVLMEWVREQESPALVISIFGYSKDERSERLTYIQGILRDTLGYASYYRWITRDTVVIAVSKDKEDYSEARTQIQNPHWILKIMSWPNTFILKEKNK